MKLAIALALAVFSYHFNETAVGNYPHSSDATVLVDGSRWRIDSPGIVSNALIGAPDGSIVAINDSNQTWYRLKTRTPRPIGSPLFNYPPRPSVANISVAFADAAKSRLAFSYDLLITIGSEKVRGRVWGEIRVWTREGDEKLPLSPINIATGVEEVDSALRSQLAQVPGVVWKSETDVSRRIENGETLHQLITRSAGPVTGATAKASDFEIPKGYREQQPVIGAPGK